jgi:lysophospholipase L1-like esterase
VILLLCSSLLALLVAEGVARWFLPYPIVGLYPNTRQEVRARGRPPAILSTNSLGLRGDEPPPAGSGIQTIIAIGGSTTHCWFLDDAETWPARLQQDLRAAGANVWVGNGGLEGHSTNSHLYFVREIVAPLRPGTTVFLVGINDLLYALEGARPGLFGSEKWWEADARLLATRSRLLQLLAVALQRVRAPRAQVIHRPWSKDRPLSGPSPGGLFAKRAQDELRHYLDNVRQLASEATALGIHPVFLTQPTLYEDTPRWLARKAPVRFAGPRLQISAAQIAALLGVYNRALLDLCRTEGLDCLDLASHVPHDPRYFYDWVHFDAAGAALVAEEVAKFLLSHGIVTTQTSTATRAMRSR